VPELAEVERARREWDPGIGGRVREVFLRGEKRIFRGFDPTEIPRTLTGCVLLGSEAHGKQMMFRFAGGSYLGVHLGMTGHLRVERRDHSPETHDHLVLFQAKRALVLRDPRLFGRVTFSAAGPPRFWCDRPPGVTDPAFTRERVAQFLIRRANSPVKALLLDQTVFPGVGNWMADEILWRAEIHPRRGGGSLDDGEVRRLWRETRYVAREALRRIADRGVDPPASWLFSHRWVDGGRCPRTQAGLIRETIGGRTTCWSPGRQTEP
jgi:formamidopyrimidine-DNA glycosylase